MSPAIPDRFGRRALATATAALVLLAGCADMSGISSQAHLRDAESLGLGADVAHDVIAQIDTNTVDPQWWLAFGDAQLNALIDQALKDSPNLQIAYARVERAQAAAGVARSADWPQIGAGLDLTRQKFSENFIYPPPLGGSVREMGTFQFNGSWELDFFGKNRSALEAAIGTVNAAQAEASASRILLATRVARGYIQWARLNGQQDVARRMLAQRQDALHLVRDRVSAGLDSMLELRESEAGLPEARQRIEALDEQIEQTRHALDALVGQPGATQALVPPKLDAFKAIPLQASIPADLLGHRADVAAARWRVEAATQDVANAKSQFYPNINIAAFAGFQSLGFDQLFKSASQQWGVGPAIRLPIFEGGRLRANLHGKNADLDAAIESYNATVLDAVRDVADQVTAVQSIARQQVQQRQGQAAAEGAYAISLQRYRAGLGNYLNVLTAETSVLAQRREGVDLAARALDAQVGLAHALGGGYDPEAAALKP